MLIIGVNGGSGCGKSNVSKRLSQLGCYHIDCDLTARKVVEIGTPCNKELIEYFGNSIRLPDGSIDRKQLAKLAFSSKKETGKLNEITHKYILADIRHEIDDKKKKGCEYVIIDGAALIESGIDKWCDCNIAVIAPKNRRIEFIMNRDNLTYEQATLRINAQKKDDYYTSVADFVIANDSDLDSLLKKTEKLFFEIKNKYKNEVITMEEKTEIELLKDRLFYTEKNGFDTMSDEEIDVAYDYAKRYVEFLNKGRTERECVKASVELLENAGFVPYEFGKKYNAGDKIYYNNRQKSIVAAVIGKESLAKGVNISAGHIDSPRLDIKPTPMYEDNDLCLLKTHYYGGVKKYQWTTIPLALCGVIIKADGTKLDINIGCEDDEPVFCITDLLPHLGKSQMEENLAKAIKAEQLNILIGSRPFKNDKSADRVKLNIMSILNKKYGIVEKDFTRAELCVVPAFKAKDMGFDRSMILAYGHDDKVCSFPCLSALLDLTEVPNKTAVAVLTDREEIGSTGNTGLEASYLKHFIQDLCNANGVNEYECLHNSTCLSADVNAAFDPTYPQVMDKYNCAHINCGPVLTKYTGSGGKAQTSDASAEFVAKVERIMDNNNVVWQTGELGKADEGGGGTVAKFVARYDITVVDIGVAVLSMHAPYETISKLDLYMMYKAIISYFREA